MKNLTHTLISLGAFAAAALVAQAQPAPKILVVDMAKIFDNHYETKAEKAKLDDASQKAQAEIDTMNKEGNALVAEYKELDEQSKSPMATSDAKAKALAAAQKKGQEIQSKMQDINTFANNAKQSIQQRIQTFRSMMMDEISKVVVQVGKRHDATLVLDKSGPTLLGVPPVIYADSSYDITPEVIAEIEAHRPAGAGSTAPAPAPASTTPQITVPGVTAPAQ
jgi:outer membrane protein